MKKILALLLAVVMVAAMLASCGMNKSDLNRVNDAEKLVVGVTVYPPMDYLDENGEWTGFDAELAQQFADYLGVNCQIVIITVSRSRWLTREMRAFAYVPNTPCRFSRRGKKEAEPLA